MMTTSTLIALQDMWRRGLGTKEMAEAAGVTRDTLWNYMRNHRDQFPHRNHHEGWWRERLAEVEGMPPTHAARRLGVSETTVASWRRRLGM